MRRGGPDYRCTFCGKRREAVRRLIAGPGVYICNECVALCNEIIAHDEHSPPGLRGEEPGTREGRRTTPWWKRLGRRRQAVLGSSNG